VIRIVLGSVLSAVVLFVYGMASWMALGIHIDTMFPVPDAPAALALVQGQLPKSGVYVYPMIEPPSDASTEVKTKAMEEMMALHRQGPIFSIFYSAEGAEMMGPEMLGRGFGINLACSLIAAILLWMAAPSLPRFLQRVFFVALLGAFAAIFRDVALYNWMIFPWPWTQAMITDVVVSWVLGGVILGAIVKRPAATQAPSATA
jgi:hypothetical protein